MFSQFAYEEDFCSEESKPDTTVFSSLTLGPEWLFPNGPVRGIAYVDERPETIVHGISLPCAVVSSNLGSGTSNSVARLIQSKQFAVMVEMFFEPKDGDAAGLLVSKSDSSGSLFSKTQSSQYFFYRIPTGLSLRRLNDQASDVLAETDLPDFVTRVYLRVECNNNLLTFFYRYEGSGPDDWTQVGDSIDIASDTSSDVDAIIVGLCAEHSASE